MGGVFRGDCLSDEDLRDSPSGGATRSTSDCGEGKAEPSDGSEPRPSNKPLRPAEQQSPRGSRRNCLDRSLHTGASRSGAAGNLRQTFRRCASNATQASPLQVNLVACMVVLPTSRRASGGGIINSGRMDRRRRRRAIWRSSARVCHPAASCSCRTAASARRPASAPAGRPT